MRLWIAAFLLFLFACQALPVAALGKTLAKMQLSDTDDGGDDEDGSSAPESGGKVKKEVPLSDGYDIHSYECAARLSERQAARQTGLHRPDQLPVRYTGEVLTPPPDRC